MLSERDIIAKIQHLTVTRLRVWVQQGWIRPVAKAEEAFTEADMARAALIRDLEDKLGFDEEQVPVLLSLIDQIHGLRVELKTILEVLDDLPEDVHAMVKLRIEESKRAR